MFEYRVTQVANVVGKEEVFLKHLNAMGEENWELVHIEQTDITMFTIYYKLIWKRHKVEVT